MEKDVGKGERCSEQNLERCRNGRKMQRERCREKDVEKGERCKEKNVEKREKCSKEERCRQERGEEKKERRINKIANEEFEVNFFLAEEQFKKTKQRQGRNPH